VPEPGFPLVPRSTEIAVSTRLRSAIMAAMISGMGIKQLCAIAFSAVSPTTRLYRFVCSSQQSELAGLFMKQQYVSL
jgi:hypothetical protein